MKTEILLRSPVGRGKGVQDLRHLGWSQTWGRGGSTILTGRWVRPGYEQKAGQPGPVRMVSGSTWLSRVLLDLPVGRKDVYDFMSLDFNFALHINIKHFFAV